LACHIGYLSGAKTIGVAKKFDSLAAGSILGEDPGLVKMVAVNAVANVIYYDHYLI